MKIHKITKTQIGSRIPKGTAGSVLFINSFGNLAQDNSNLFWDIINKRLGVEVSTPSEKLEVHGNMFLDTDGNKYYSGAGKDMSIYYDGTNGYIKTDEVVPSDLKVSCGANKTIELQETVWDDQQIVLGSVGFGASAPAWTAYKGSEVLAFNKSQDNKIFFTAQLTHKYKLGTNIEFHIHDIPADDTAGVVRWIFTYSWADMGSDFPAESTITSEQTVVVNTADKHIYFDLDELTGTSSGVSSVLLCSLIREGSHANDTYDNDVYLAAMDFHIQLDTIGSRQEGAK